MCVCMCACACCVLRVACACACVRVRARAGFFPLLCTRKLIDINEEEKARLTLRATARGEGGRERKRRSWSTTGPSGGGPEAWGSFILVPCVSLLYVIDTVSTGSRGEPGDCLSTLRDTGNQEEEEQAPATLRS